MTQIIMLIPASLQAGAKTVAFGLFDALTSKNVRAAILPELDRDVVEQILAANNQDEVLNRVFEQVLVTSISQDVVIIYGFPLVQPYAAALNFALATALNAATIFVTAAEEALQNNLRQLKIIAATYEHHYSHRILGLIVNKTSPEAAGNFAKYADSLEIKIPLLGLIPYKNEIKEKSGSMRIDVTLGATISKYLDLSWLWPFLNDVAKPNFTPTMFRHLVFSLAREANKKIILPEGHEPRTLQAANICMAQGIARCVLLGKKQEIYDACAKINLKLNEKIEIIEPQSVSDKYIAPLCEARRAKGMTPEEAGQQLQDNVMLGTMMMHLGEADGLVSGAVHTTANTIRPALQIIKAAADVKLVSSIFFMCLPDQVLVYGDCAINANPNAEELADIAIQSAKSAAAFGITPRVAMLSYSTGNSGAGPDVEVVKAAVAIVNKLWPDLAIDGPLQYDAAIDKNVAMLKAPNSKVAGHATVFIMPNLNTGNICYKAVQRSTGIVCVGPMLQGLRKPVNDLSRGCSVEDIVFTIAITAVQALRVSATSLGYVA